MAEELLAPGAITMHHQPMVSLASGDVFAFEALMRPQVEGVSDPLSAFQVAEKAGVASDLDRACIDEAMSGLAELADDTRLFVNVSPITLLDGSVSPEGLARRILQRGGPPARVVVELTEHAEVDDLAALARATAELRRAGLGLALDDAGAGNTSLQRIGRLRPDFVKLDRSLVQGCDKDDALLELVGVLCDFCETIGAVVVAEGVENLHELAAVRRVGADLVQGFGIARPGPGFPEVSAVAARSIRASSHESTRRHPTAKTLATPLATVGRSTTTADALARFDADDDLGLIAIIDDDGSLIGTIGRREVERLRAGASPPNGDAASGIANRTPLVVAEWSDPASVAQQAAARSDADDHEDVILAADDGRITGRVSVLGLLAFLAGASRREHEGRRASE